MADERDRADRAEQDNREVVNDADEEPAEGGGGEEQLRAVEQTEERLDEEEDDEETPSDVGPDRSQRD